MDRIDRELIFRIILELLFRVFRFSKASFYAHSNQQQKWYVAGTNVNKSIFLGCQFKPEFGQGVVGPVQGRDPVLGLLSARRVPLSTHFLLGLRQSTALYTSNFRHAHVLKWLLILNARLSKYAKYSHISGTQGMNITQFYAGTKASVFGLKDVILIRWNYFQI